MHHYYALKKCAVILPDPQNHKYLVASLAGFQHLMAIDTAPGGNVVPGSGIGARDRDYVPGSKLRHAILQAYDGQRAKQASRIQ